MELALSSELPPVRLPNEYAWAPWQDTLLEDHSATLFQCFQEEIDAMVFPSLGNRQGCRLLMGEIRGKPGFLPEATWLLQGPTGFCGTVQGVRERKTLGAIQNLGIVGTHRRQGLGRALLLRSLQGFQRAGLQTVVLEVTASNEEAVRLYQQVGFRKRKTLYKAVDTSLAARPLISDL
jgi:hypothetical protein